MNIERFKHYLKTVAHAYAFAGLSGEDYSEQSRKVLLINLFCLVGVVVTLPLGLLALSKAQYMTALTTLGIAFLYIGNHFYLRHTYNYSLSSNLILYPLFGLMFYLLHSGGVAQTGFVWIFCLPAVALFLHGLRRGMIEILLFVTVVLALFRFPEALGTTYEWPSELKSRILYSFGVVTFLSAFFEYSRMKSLTLLEALRDEMALAAQTDPLTGLLNRRGMMQRIEAVYHKVDAEAMLVICDVDYFKQLNDEFGHSRGDAVLQRLAELFHECCATDAQVCRWGGEEFLVLVYGVEPDQVYGHVSRLRSRIEAENFGDVQHPIHLTVSFGVAPLSKQLSIDASIILADKQLYQAKAEGRNRICVA